MVGKDDLLDGDLNVWCSSLLDRGGEVHPHCLGFGGIYVGVIGRGERDVEKSQDGCVMRENVFVHI
jgi:hypothetical protein